jgi:hypothetical protein
MVKHSLQVSRVSKGQISYQLEVNMIHAKLVRATMESQRTIVRHAARVSPSDCDPRQSEATRCIGGETHQAGIAATAANSVYDECVIRATNAALSWRATPSADCLPLEREVSWRVEG